MRSTNSYLSGLAAGENGGIIVLQEACIKEKSGEVPVVLAAVFSERGKVQRSFSVELGEWFQNVLVPMVRTKGTDSLINVCMTGIGRNDLSERLKTVDYSCAIIAGKSCALFRSGDTSFIYSVEELMGKSMLIPMCPGADGIMVELEAGGVIMLADRCFSQDGFYKKQVAEAVETVDNEKAFNGLLEEAISIEDTGVTAIVAVKAV